MDNTSPSSRAGATSWRGALPWIACALAAGLVVGWFDRSATEVQSTILQLMLVAFALSVPGRASLFAIGAVTGAGIGLLALVTQPASFSPAMFIAIIPATIAAAAGRYAGGLLDVANASMDRPPATPEPSDAPWNQRPVPVRALLATALIAVALLGTVSVRTSLVVIEHPLASFVALIWQAVSFIGWIALTPVIVRLRAYLNAKMRNAGADVRGVSVAEAAAHVAVLTGLIFVHATAMTMLVAVLQIPLGPGGLPALLDAALRIYALLDPLVYAAVLGIAFSADVSRHVRDAATREAALQGQLSAAQLDALRAQLNPHFLYNALNAVGVLANAGRNDETVRTLEQLSELLRYVLDGSRPHVPLSSELAFVRSYLEIQHVRFGQRLRYTIDAPAELGSAPVPPLVLQPLVENAVEHGIAATMAGGTVAIRARAEDGMLVLTVEDDGESTAALATARDGVGLGNTRERVERMYGGRARVSLERRADRGVTCTVRLPMAAAAPA